MSGGSLDYFFSQLREHAGDFGDVELDDLVKDLAELFYNREWFLSSDTNEGVWREARKAFKQKWLYKDARGERFQQYIEEAVEKLRDDFGLNDHKRCETCQHWTQNRGNYGSCKFESEGLIHKGEVCKKWEEREDVKALEIQLRDQDG